MSALSVTHPYPIFTDSDGTPLDNGYIWIGMVNLDPQGYPINVYWDAALTQLAGQPIRTMNGYPVRNGSPARLYVNSDYSIRVQNKNAATLYNAPVGSDAVGDISSALVTFVQAGTGAVSRTVQAKLRDTVSVKDFGAVGDGVTDDTAAIQAAINASVGFLSVYFPSGTYKVTSQITIANDRVMLHGDGSATKILFMPTANAVCFLFDKGSTSSVQNTIRDISFYSTDTTYTKTAIKLVDVSQCIVENVRTISPHWYGNGSIFLHILGRDNTTVTSVSAFADKPIRISPIPAPHVAAGIGIDHFHFSDCYLGNTVSANPLITIDDGVSLTHTTFDGYQAWVGGNYGLYWNDTTSAGVSIGLHIENARWEQPFTPGGYMLYINRTAAFLQQLNFSNCYAGSSSVNGVYLRTVQYFDVNNFVYSSTLAAFDANTTCSFGKVFVTATNNLATVSISALRTSGKYLIGGNVTDLLSSVPAGSNLTQLWNPSKTLGFSQLEPKAFTVSAGATITFATNALRGLVFIYADSATVSGVLACNGTGNSTRVLVQSDAGWFGTSAGAANYNLYHSGGNYVLQNNTASSATFHAVTMGTGER